MEWIDSAACRKDKREGEAEALRTMYTYTPEWDRIGQNDDEMWVMVQSSSSRDI
jgi:hypothetical protein